MGPEPTSLPPQERAKIAIKNSDSMATAAATRSFPDPTLPQERQVPENL